MFNLIKEGINKSGPFGKYILHGYGSCVLFGGIIGLFTGLSRGIDMVQKRESIKLIDSMEQYEFILNGIINSSVIATSAITTGLTSMVVVAVFPVSVPILLKYKEPSKSN
jgi:hypothetical protein